jgi:hypothetical protein
MVVMSDATERDVPCIFFLRFLSIHPSQRTAGAADDCLVARGESVGRREDA